jgi:siroheme synthase
MIFGRAGEEIDACRKAGIAIEVVPGITAAQGAASRLGISLTQRRDARRVQYVTGHAGDGKLPQDLDWRSLADPSVTFTLGSAKVQVGITFQSANCSWAEVPTAIIRQQAIRRIRLRKMGKQVVIGWEAGSRDAKLRALARGTFAGRSLMFVALNRGGSDENQTIFCNR